MMKRETKRRIAYYQDALPDMKKKVAAAALMLLIAVIISITATYAWITLSVAPVVSSVNTTMSANGTLEIALSAPEGIENPPKDQDIDETVTASSDVTVSNLRWGNLVNLSDTSYGIDNLVLRPAQLNTASLKNNPLKGAVYGADGRIETLTSNYAYVKWDPLGEEFIPPETDEGFGVRAIASFTLKTSGSTQSMQIALEQKVSDAQSAVDAAYKQVPGRMQDLSPMLTKFAQSKLDGTEAVFSWSELQAAHDLYKSVYDAMVLQKDAYVALANLQSYIAHKNAGTQYVELTWENLEESKDTFNAAKVDAIKSEGVSLVELSSFIADLSTAEADVGYLKSYYEDARDIGTEYKWSSGGQSGHQISNIVTNMIDYGSMTMELGSGNNKKEVKLVSLSAGNATDILANTSPNVYVYGGIFKRFEQLAINESSRMRGEANKANVKITIKYKGIPLTINGKCFTKATDTSYFDINVEKAKNTQLAAKDIVAEDTYGMAVDFWLRTNAEETYLTLEGAVAADENGDIYSYDGVNRVWGSTGNANLTTNSTTQGGGSCYIYYADTPEDMARSLELLRSMKVAFVNQDGDLLAQAAMDTAEDSVYAVNGRVTVPLVLEETSGVSYVYVDEKEAEVTGRAVTMMTHDEPLWITAIVYLDGAYLGNDQVLSADQIDGQLNIQFGSSVDLETLGDNKLLTAERVVSATATPNKLDWATGEMTTDVTVTVDGTAPENVTAFFVRAINATQGERQKTMTDFQPDAEHREWTTSYTFDAPGVYYLRHVRLDGVDYTLETPVKVEVDGFSISEVKVLGAAAGEPVYTPESFYETEVTAKITSSDTSKRPQTVQARFLRDNGIMVNVDMRYDPSGVWKGTGTFYRSGTYTLQYMLLDGEYYDVSNDENVLTLYLGLNVAVYGEGGSMKPEEFEAGKEYFKNVTVAITDNDGKQLPVYEYTEDGEIATDLDGNPIMLPWVTNPKPQLVYSPGGANTVKANLDWSVDDDKFVGTLLITAPGRYTFRSLEIGNNSLTRATESAVYTIMSPDQPVYVVSQSTALQFAPLTNDGIIGPIKIKESSTVALVAEIYNDVTKQTYFIPNEVAEGAYDAEQAGIVGGGEPFTLTPDNGTMTYNQETGSWIIQPVYTSGKTATQEGTWSVKNLYVWEFRGEDGAIRDVTQIEKWSGETYDYSGLTTKISCTLKVEMVPGTTEMGSDSTDFMANHYVKDIGMEVLMRDNSGNTITGPVLNKMTVKMLVSYDGNTGGTDTAKTAELVEAYGYEVVDMNETYDLTFTYNAAKERWVLDETTPSEVTANYNWQYVGEYKVKDGLSVHVADGSADGELVSSDVITGVPEKYTVKSKTPTTDDLTIGSFTQGKTTFGKDTNGKVTGFFLDGYGGADLGKITVVLQYEDENGQYQTAEHAKIPISVELHLTYQNGSTAPNGGYSWSGDNEAMTKAKLTMVNTNGVYTAPAKTPLLAGTYTVKAVVTCGGETKNFDGKNISVYSMKPTVTMTAVSPTTEVTVNKDAGIKVSKNTTKAYNAILDDGKSAVVFMSCTSFTGTDNPGKETTTGSTNTTYSDKYANYTEPKITFALSNAGDICKEFSISIPSESTPDKPINVSFSGNNTSKEAVIGSITNGTDDIKDGLATYRYKTETPNVIGTQLVKTLSAVYNSVTYNVPLSDTVSIVQRNEGVPSISFENGSIETATQTLTFTSPEGQTAENGRPFTIKLPTAAEIGTQKATYYGDLVIAEGTEWVESNRTENEKYAMYVDVGSIVSEYPQTETRKEGSGLFGTKYFVTGISKYYFNYNIYYRYTINYTCEGTISIYNATFGVENWIIDGKSYEPGDEFTVTKANTTVKPVIGRLELGDVVDEKTGYLKGVANEVTLIETRAVAGNECESEERQYEWHNLLVVENEVKEEANELASSPDERIDPTDEGIIIISSTDYFLPLQVGVPTEIEIVN